MNAMQAIEMTYTDRCSVYRVVEVEKPSGETITERKTIYDSIKCALSKKDAYPADQTNTVNKVQFVMKLFLNPMFTILPGDEIHVESFGATYKTIAGMPRPYDSHQEIALEVKENA
ncbi:ABC transporter ATP-binding protein [Brevibacillus laterosporus]|uniref:ABC transporter ATP-binding protein n=1 Tax=Brevibacillus laterosporus TaxID=1465 RepID=UPI000C77D93D|nr:ABC transporter ATP-binding protein [Brevibacillus laterosporus]AUM66322.1 ABC transporter ATP-binding protein [Brevibacillus laterosporus]